MSRMCKIFRIYCLLLVCEPEQGAWPAESLSSGTENEGISSEGDSSIQLSMPRRSRMVTFTCNKCGEQLSSSSVLRSPTIADTEPCSANSLNASPTKVGTRDHKINSRKATSPLTCICMKHWQLQLSGCFKALDWWPLRTCRW